MVQRHEAKKTVLFCSAGQTFSNRLPVFLREQFHRLAVSSGEHPSHGEQQRRFLVAPVDLIALFFSYYLQYFFEDHFEFRLLHNVLVLFIISWRYEFFDAVVVG